MNHHNKRKLRRDRYCPVCGRPIVTAKPTADGPRICEAGHTWKMVAGRAVVTGSLVGV